MNDSGSSEKKIPRQLIQDLPKAAWPPIQRDSKSGRPVSEVRRMNLNESPFPPSPAAISAMQEAVLNVNYYPDPTWRDLRQALSDHTGHPFEQINIGHGSDEMIVTAGRVALTEGDEVVVPAPSFPGYAKCAAINGAKLVGVKVRQDGSCDVDGMIEAVTDKTRLVFLCTPNNPTGGFVSTEDVVRLAKSLPKSCLMILDEAYYEYGIHAGGPDHLAAMREIDVPWIAFRTFSKAYGLAGMRVGYGLCGSLELAESFEKVRSVFNVNAVAQAGALAALKDQDYMKETLSRTTVERERIAETLVRHGFEVFPSVGNFLAAKSPIPVAEVVQQMDARGIMIGRLMMAGFEDYIRVTTGRPADTDAFIQALDEILG